MGWSPSGPGESPLQHTASVCFWAFPSCCLQGLPSGTHCLPVLAWGSARLGAAKAGRVQPSSLPPPAGAEHARPSPCGPPRPQWQKVTVLVGCHCHQQRPDPTQQPDCRKQGPLPGGATRDPMVRFPVNISDLASDQSPGTGAPASQPRDRSSKTPARWAGA